MDMDRDRAAWPPFKGVDETPGVENVGKQEWEQKKDHCHACDKKAKTNKHSQTNEMLYIHNIYIYLLVGNIYIYLYIHDMHIYLHMDKDWM